MAFIADPIALRTWDPDRGFELFKTGGGLMVVMASNSLVRIYQ
jgi:hypothetical protein